MIGTSHTRTKLSGSSHENLRKVAVAPKSFRYIAKLQITSEPLGESTVLTRLTETLTGMVLKDSIFSRLAVKEVDENLYSVEFALFANTWKDASMLSQALVAEAYSNLELIFDEEEDAFKTTEKTYFYRSGSQLTLSGLS